MIQEVEELSNMKSPFRPSYINKENVDFANLKEEIYSKKRGRAVLREPEGVKGPESKRRRVNPKEEMSK